MRTYGTYFEGVDTFKSSNTTYFLSLRFIRLQARMNYYYVSVRHYVRKSVMKHLARQART